jgi:hypothetical protein
MKLNWSIPLVLTHKGSTRIPKTSGLYKILSSDLKGILYLGESKKLASRLAQHCTTYKDCTYQFSFVKLPKNIKKYQLHELENDLIAAYYQLTSTIPKFQFSSNR